MQFLGRVPALGRIGGELSHRRKKERDMAMERRAMDVSVKEEHQQQQPIPVYFVVIIIISLFRVLNLCQNTALFRSKLN